MERTKRAENAWLQNGYKNFKDALYGLKYMEFVDELRIISAAFHEKSRSSSRVGVVSRFQEDLNTRDNLGDLLSKCFAHNLVVSFRGFRSDRDMLRGSGESDIAVSIMGNGSICFVADASVRGD